MKHEGDIPDIEWQCASTSFYQARFIGTRDFRRAGNIWRSTEGSAWHWSLNFYIGAEREYRHGTAACRGAAMRAVSEAIHEAHGSNWRAGGYDQGYAAVA